MNKIFLLILLSALVEIKIFAMRKSYEAYAMSTYAHDPYNPTIPIKYYSIEQIPNNQNNGHIRIEGKLPRLEISPKDYQRKHLYNHISNDLITNILQQGTTYLALRVNDNHSNPQAFYIVVAEIEITNAFKEPLKMWATIFIETKYLTARITHYEESFIHPLENSLKSFAIKHPKYLMAAINITLSQSKKDGSIELYRNKLEYSQTYTELAKRWIDARRILQLQT